MSVCHGQQQVRCTYIAQSYHSPPIGTRAMALLLGHDTVGVGGSPPRRFGLLSLNLSKLEVRISMRCSE